MCGIFGHIGTIPKNSADRCTDALYRRGPDGRGVWQGDGVTLGHRRLSILDLSELGAQPMTYADGRYRITYNGEIYNFLELRADLEKMGHRFRSASDTEVILAAFAEWGEACQQRFNGMWAFAIWDEQEKSLFLSRDRFGKKPLFYTSLPTGFAFASEMKALFPLLPEVRPNIALVKDWARIFRYESTCECLVEGIRRFPAGHCGWLRDGQLTLTRWWCTLDHLPAVPERYEDQVEALRELFLDACRLRMRSDVPIGTALSGGLDSSATIAAMAHLARSGSGERSASDWQHAFVACFPGTALDESGYARKVADHLGIRATFLEIDPLKAIDRLPEYLYIFEELYLTSPIPFMMTYGAMRPHGVKVTMDGHGADELFAGYSFDYIHALTDAGLHPARAKLVLDTMYDADAIDISQFPLPPKWRYWLKWYAGMLKNRVIRRRPPWAMDLQHPRLQDMDTLNRTLYAEVHENVLPTLLRNYDRYSMGNGVEIRMPFMDYRIACFAFAIPWTTKIRRGYSKCIVRDAVAPFLPHEVAYRKNKVGFNTPIVEWMKGPLRSYFLDALASTSFRTSTLINPTDVSRHVRQVIDDENATYAMGESAWTELMPYLWEQAVIKGWKTGGGQVGT